jgi:diaminohydroxyphosphoribosylaminopyrimidine deaminase/5-amino-6-(5-phosphoribosylamino)uracil reductase
MAHALALAALAEGRTRPNPRVGCVLVRDGQVVGRGYHPSPGQPHAEAVAIDDAGPRAAGATLYVNLEPCDHHGRTPPCSDLLIRAGIRRVVASIQDPNPLVDGRGFSRLRAAGIEVDVGALAPEARAVNEPFLHWHRHGRPLVTLKAAVTLDGMLAARGGRSRWITGAESRRFAHRLRLRHDAVLVGAGTVRADDPRLSARLCGSERIGPRVVLSESGRLDPAAAVFRRDAGDPATRVYTAEGAGAAARERLGPGAEVIVVPATPEGLSLAHVLEDLGRAGIQSLLVEGGGRTLAAFLASGVADRAVVFSSATLLGARGGVPFVDADAETSPERGWRVVRERLVPLGDDLALLGRIESRRG